MEYEDISKKLVIEFSDFLIDEDDYDLPYIVAGNFQRFLLESYNNNEKEIYHKGLDFIEKLHLSYCSKVRELATIGYLESFLDWSDKDTLFNDLGAESKKWWVELNLFWSGEIKYIGESFI